MLRDFAQPLSDVLYMVRFYRLQFRSSYYYGNAYCGDENTECLRDLKLTEINQICKSCIDDEDLRYCSLILNF